jgi:hypothetical protein
LQKAIAKADYLTFFPLAIMRTHPSMTKTNRRFEAFVALLELAKKTDPAEPFSAGTMHSVQSW